MRKDEVERTMGKDEDERIAAVVRSILKSADMDVMTEAKVRKQASEETGIDLSQKRYRQRVQELIEEFLVSEDAGGDSEGESEAQHAPAEAREEESENDEEADAQPLGKRAKRNPTEEEEEEDRKGGKGEMQERTRMDDGALLICQLTSKRNLTVSDWKGMKLVSVREFYEKDGQILPGKGISLTRDQWNELKKGFPAVGDAIQMLKKDAT